jgi:hypothetical protein
MFSMIFLAGLFGYGLGFEGVEKGKVYIGVYTPRCEYGWVVSEKEIYLDTIFEKRIDK